MVWKQGNKMVVQRSGEGLESLKSDLNAQPRENGL